MNALPPGLSAAETKLSQHHAPSASRRRLAIILLCAAGLCSAGYFGQDWWRHGRFIESTDDAYVGGDITAIAPHVAGFVSDIPVADNAHVGAGQVLAHIDERDYQAELDHADAVVAEATASLLGLRAQRIVQLASIRQASADLSAKSARAAFTSVDRGRYADLSDIHAGSRQDAERAQTAAQEAQAALTASQAGLEASRAQLDVLDAQISQAEAAVAQGKADLRRARLYLGYTEIRAPVEGFVANRAARPGAYVSAGTYLLSIIPAVGLWVDANFKEDQLAGIRPGQPATLVADAAPGYVFHGRVESLAAGTGAVFSVIPPENATGNFTKIAQRVPVRIALEPDGALLDRLRPGLSVTVSVDTRQAP